MPGAVDLDFGTLNPTLMAADPAANLARSISSEPDLAPGGRWAGEAAALLKDTPRGAGINFMRPAGPISDAFILAVDPIMVIAGPQGSGKTIAAVKKLLVEGQRIAPGADGVRRYKLGVWRKLYDNLWKSTIPSYWKILPKDLAGSTWTGASPRAARHIVRFQDRWGLVEITVDFIAFGDVADPEDLRGLEFTDVWLNEIDTLPDDLMVWLIGRIGREPPPEITGRQGRIFGDMNAPDVLNWTYKTFYEDLPAGYRLFRQPGGMEPNAENLASYGGNHSYYEQQIKLNANRQWWVRRMVHGIPGMSRETDLVYERFDERTMVSRTTLNPSRSLPVIVGIDGGLTPAAVYMQEHSDGQLCVLAEIALERGGMDELGEAMLALEARRFRGCEFHDVCDPAMKAGEDDDSEFTGARRNRLSDRQALAAKLGRKVILAATQEPNRRWEAVRAKVSLNLGVDRPGILVDPSCRGLIRGFLQTYHFRKLRGTNDLSSIQPTFDTHVHDGLQYGACECGTDAARKRRTDIVAARRRAQEQARVQGRFSPGAYRRRRG